MTIHELRFYIIEELIRNEPPTGWVHEKMTEKMKELDREISEKSVRTILNGLEDAGILLTRKEGKVKHYFIDRTKRTTDDEEEKFSDEYLFIASVYSAMLHDMSLTDINAAATSFQKQLAYVMNNPDHRNSVSKLSENVFQNTFGLKKITRGQASVLVNLLRNKGKLSTLTLTDGENITFVSDRFVIRESCLIVCGINAETHAYCELLPVEIQSAASLKTIYDFGQLRPQERNKLNFAHLTIGAPTGGQADIIVLRLSDEAVARIKGKSMPLDFELRAEEKELQIEHACNSSLADWIIGLGTGVTVQEPEEMRDLVKQRLHEMLTAYES
ncbi:MAG: WYL domain-containing protein [Candidatus Cyclonatronum sp.]|uniref:WYL domain-containing protein n=1 Tax=Cyclonatronum sp. TaxID=3024185 RepID=UPI0025C058CB|nr:WYL domain-containing protein [Cyclonatronum sp.]MCH8488030.1 WYL domain-containing protein [Cyclonatronum sp.]